MKLTIDDNEKKGRMFCNAKFAKIHSKAILPERKTSYSAGYDLHVIGKHEINPGCVALLPTGIVAIPPKGYRWELVLRSGTCIKKPGLMLANGIGVIDSDFTGPDDEIKIAVINNNLFGKVWTIEDGERIAQLVLRKNFVPDVLEISSKELKDNSRGGWGSTGAK